MFHAHVLPLRRLASRHWYHPDAQVIGMVSVEAGTAGQYEVVITLERPIGFRGYLLSNVLFFLFFFAGPPPLEVRFMKGVE